MSILTRLRRMVAGGRHRPVALPTSAWFDEPGAIDEITERAGSTVDERILRSWVRDGYAIVEDVVPHDLLDEMVGDLDRMFIGDRPLDDLVVHDLELDGGHRATTSHSELLTLDREDRVAIRDRSSWRVHGFFQHSGAADAVRNHPELRRVASMILGVDSRATYSINFHNGSRQALHQDTAVFHLGVPTLICGAWIACEDIVEGSGPLVYYPGSHRERLFAGFDGYPMVNLRTADPALSGAYQAHVDGEAARFEQREFLAKKGDVLFWHGMLIHGGQQIRRADSTRRSFVVHFIPDGADVADQVTAPVNW
ncbi:MAG: phytanoyl-CoA dioxygenase family protein [Ilumatobacter sp.]|uniref:phytanoyl-CoA dioxygenase family protein n=1 Tax=Ilumatobacter sp. TaxID=1967498 RepID=UPI00260DCD8D|nr:phytanoyl-CoA dioxygenase family protein [Ilumatobacter sp.]MDJ0767898.1 phytanoyl-CoA dioxygenase family protein [Ilumatobacter sp.]